MRPEPATIPSAAMSPPTSAPNSRNEPGGSARRACPPSPRPWSCATPVVRRRSSHRHVHVDHTELLTVASAVMGSGAGLKVDGGVFSQLDAVVDAAVALERRGYDGCWTAEVNHDLQPCMCRKASFGIRARAIAPATKPSAKAARKLPRFIEPPFPGPRPILAVSPACETGRSLHATPISPRYKVPDCRPEWDVQMLPW